MNRVKIQKRVIEIVSDHLQIALEEVTLNSLFADDLGADSLDRVELMMALEEEFDLEIPDEEAEKLQTVNAAIDFIEEKLKNK